MSGDAAAAAGGLVVLGLAWRLRWLTGSAVAAALGVGTAVLAGGGGGALSLLLFFFVTASALTRLGGVGKPATGPEHRTDRPRGRRARQVAANGGVAAAAALAGLAGWLPASQVAVAGALAAATADTWATEVGTWAGAATRLVTTWERVEPGRSGGVSWPGTAAGAAGALSLGLLAGLVFEGRTPGAWLGLGLVAGSAGLLVDSLLGATFEDRLRWVDNEVVNLGGTLAGAAAGLLAAGLFSG